MGLDNRTILGITREPDFSLGKKEADSAILRLTFDWLATRGVGTRQAPGEDPGAWGAPPAMVLSMARGEEALDSLARWEKEGIPVVNTIQSVRDCSKLESLIARLEETPFKGFRIPRTFLCEATRVNAVAEAKNTIESWDLPMWAKGTNPHGRITEDVFKVNAAEGLAPALAILTKRGIDRVLFQEVVEGETLRFCGVGRERFWFWRSVAERRHLPYADAITTLGRDASARLGLEIYGGNAVVTPEGEIFLIDLNDWPDFTGCQADASDAIAELSCERLGIPG